MWVLSVLCAVLPLAASLETCDDAIAQIFLSKKQLEGKLLDNICGRQFWSPLTANYEFDHAANPSKYLYGPLDKNACNFSLSVYDNNGTQIVQMSRVVADVIDNTYLGYSLSSVMSAFYAFECSENLILVYRCQMAWQSGGPKFQVFAPWSKSEADISNELSSCRQAMKAIDSSIDLAQSKHPEYI